MIKDEKEIHQCLPRALWEVIGTSRLSGYRDLNSRSPAAKAGESRNRVLSDSELKAPFEEINDNRFNLFVRFAYYTGARGGEINSISRENIFSNHM